MPKKPSSKNDALKAAFAELKTLPKEEFAKQLETHKSSQLTSDLICAGMTGGRELDTSTASPIEVLSKPVSTYAQSFAFIDLGESFFPDSTCITVGISQSGSYPLKTALNDVIYTTQNVESEIKIDFPNETSFQFLEEEDEISECLKAA